MICPQCSNGILSPSLPIPSVLSYRGFSKVVGSYTFLECPSCLYESTESYSNGVDIDHETSLFKREINARLSVGDEL